MEKNIKVEETVTVTATLKITYKLGSLKHNKASIKAIREAIVWQLSEIDEIPLYVEKDSSGASIEEFIGPVILEKVTIS